MRPKPANLSLAAIWLVTASACGKAGEVDPNDIDRAVPIGGYQITAPVCASSGEAPAYPSAAYKAALFAFDDLLAHTLVIAANAATETLSDTDCSLTLTRSILENQNNFIVFARDRRHSFNPPGCSFQVTVAGVTTQVSSETTTLFEDRSERSAEIPFTSARDPVTGQITLRTLRDPSLAQLWQTYGCSADDQMLQTLAQ